MKKKLVIILFLVMNVQADEPAVIGISDLKEAVYMLIQKSNRVELNQANEEETRSIVAEYNAMKDRVIAIKPENDSLDEYIDGFVKNNEYLLDVR